MPIAVVVVVGPDRELGKDGAGQGREAGRDKAERRPAAPLGQINYSKCRRWARSVGHFMANLICLKNRAKSERTKFNGRGHTHTHTKPTQTDTSACN